MANKPDTWSPPVGGDEIRTPPHNDEAERSMLGAVFIDNRAVDEVDALVSPEDLYREPHRHIFRAMLELKSRGEAIDVITLADHLSAEGLLDAVGGANTLARLSHEVPSASNVSYYATIVKRKASLRAFIAAAHTLIDECYSDVSDFEGFMDRAEADLFQITRSGAQKKYATMREVIREAFAQIEALYQKSEQVTGVPSGFADLDEITAGWQPSDLVILAARPAMGKCLVEGSRVMLEDGRWCAIEDLLAEPNARVVTLDRSLKFDSASLSAFVDDGLKPAFRVTTRLGRRVETTATHPLLTLSGWRSVGDLEVGARVAVPRTLPFFGDVVPRACEAKLCGYLIGDGNMTGPTPRFTQSNDEIVEDFTGAVDAFGGLRVTTSESSTRTPTYRIVHDPEYLQRERTSFGQRLKSLCRDREVSQRSLAQELGVSPSLVTQWVNGAMAPSEEVLLEICSVLECDRTELVPAYVMTLRRGESNPLQMWLKALGLWGRTASEKAIPDVVFTWSEESVALFLNRLFATDGWAAELATGQVQVGYSTASETLARQVSHLLLRFGIICKVRRRDVPYDGGRRRSWQLDVTHDVSLGVFAERIGILSKMSALHEVISRAPTRSPNTDVIPSEVWARIEESKGEESWASLSRRTGLGEGSVRPRAGGVSRERLGVIGRALEDEWLVRLAESDVVWDEIVEIESLGVRQVYDLTVPKTHNFVAEDVCVHNTAITLNMASHAALERKVPVAFFSLEMSNVQLAMRMLCSESRVDQGKMRTGRLTEQEWARLLKGAKSLSESKIFLDDTPALPIMELRSKARQLKAEHDIGIIFVDYLQLMKAPGRNIGSREQEISEISRNLKGIAKELNVPVIALAQLNRGVEQRADKRPMNSDLRESGAIEQDADIISFIYRDEVYNPESEDKGLAEVILGKHRNGSLGTVRLRFFGQFTRFENLAPGDYAES